MTGEWEATPLSDLIRTVCKPFDTQGGRNLRFDGNGLTIPRKLALDLALIVNELVTNSVKYGALSTPHGYVGVKWLLSPPPKREIHFYWEDHGGPKLGPEPPTRRGFGSFFIEKVARTHGGVATTRYTPEGVKCLLILSLT